MPGLTQFPKSLPDYIEHAARSNPNGEWAIVPDSIPGGDHEWLHITFATLARGVDQMACWVESTVGLGEEGEVIDFMGANDLRYPICVAAIIKAGYTPLLTSPRNSVEGQQSLLRNTKCRKLFYTSDIESQIQDIKHATPEVQVYMAPELDELLHPTAEIQPYVGAHQREEDAVCLILHTSGSTGLPKPIYLTVGGLRAIDTLSSLPPEDGQTQASELLFNDKRPLLAATPFFHAMGMICAMRSIMCQGTIVRLPTGRVLNADLLIEVINQTKPAAGVFPPSLLEDLSSTNEGLEALSKLDRVFFGGGPLAFVSGNKIAEVCSIIPVIGSTEAGMYATLAPSAREDWPYFQWSSATGVHMEPAEEGLKEMVVKKKDRTYQGVFHTFPELNEWRTKDLFEEHPTKRGLWKYRGRRDDVIVLSNGEKFNPVSTEKLIEGHPLVKGALVVGQAKFQAGLIIEPEWERLGLKDVDTLIDEVWPLVEKANSEAPGHARIYKSKIAVAKRDKPFKRAAKASIIRLGTNSLYGPEIEALYSNEGIADHLGSINPGGPAEDSIKFLRNAFLTTIPSFEDETSSDTDIFSLGADSLGVLSLTNALNHALPAGHTISARMIYENPTISRLATALSSAHDVDQTNAAQTRGQKMEALVQKYTADIPKSTSRPTKHVVMLTGSTGSLGNYALELLLQDPAIDNVFCLNRSNNAEARQKASFSDRGALLAHFNKAIFLQSDFSQKLFGLSEATYTRLQQHVTHVIHSAWAVDFNLALQSYEDTHIAGTRRLVDFAASATYRPSIAFVSSIASVGSWPSLHPEQAVPETLETVFDNTLPLPQGYGEGKHVTSQILAVASERLGIRTAIIRAGQLAGPSAEYASAHGGMGVWNRHEWVPTIIKTSRSLGKLPKELGSQERVDWVPMDKAADALIDLSLSLDAPSDSDGVDGISATTDKQARNTANCEVFHLINPKTTAWSALAPGIQAFFRDTSKIELQTVEYGDWLDSLKAVEATPDNVEAFPGLKLLDFYEGLRLTKDKGAEEGNAGLPILDTTHAEKKSTTLRSLQAIKEEDVLVWLRGWGF